MGEKIIVGGNRSNFPNGYVILHPLRSRGCTGCGSSVILHTTNLSISGYFTIAERCFVDDGIKLRPDFVCVRSPFCSPEIPSSRPTQSTTVRILYAMKWTQRQVQDKEQKKKYIAKHVKFYTWALHTLNSKTKFSLSPSFFQNCICLLLEEHYGLFIMHKICPPVFPSLRTI